MNFKLFKTAILSCLLLITFQSNAQTLNISNETIIHDSKERSAVKVMIAPDTKDVKKKFKDFMDDRYNVDVEGIGFLKNKDVVYTDPTVIAPISNQQMKLYARVVGENGQTAMYVFGQLGYNNQITPTSNWTEYNGMKDLTVEFLEQILPNYYKDIVDDQKDEVADLKDDRDDMVKKMNKNKEKITELQQENDELEAKIAETEARLEQSVDRLAEKRATLKKVNKKLDKTNKK